MKRAITAALLGALVMMYGCYEYEEHLTLNADGSGSVKVKYVMAEEEAADEVERWDPPPDSLRDGAIPCEKKHVEELFSGKEGLKVRDISVSTSDGQRTVSFTVTFDNFQRLQKTHFAAFMNGMMFFRNEEGRFSYERWLTEERWLGQERQPVEAPGNQDEREPIELSEEPKRNHPDLKFVFKLTLPVEIAETNAHTHAGNMAEWRIETEEEEEKWRKQGWILKAETTPADGLLLPIIVAVVIVGAFVLSLLVKKIIRKPGT